MVETLVAMMMMMTVILTMMVIMMIFFIFVATPRGVQGYVFIGLKSITYQSIAPDPHVSPSSALLLLPGSNLSSER